MLLVVLASSPLARGFRRRVMAVVYTRAMRDYEDWIAARKRELLARLSGTVLELGPGPGSNFASLPPGVTRWVGVEPNQHMHAELRRKAAEHGVDADLRTVAAEGMEVADASVDAVLCTLVLCSVEDPARVLRDVLRVLKPGGRFVFIEHVGAPHGSALRRGQRLVRPLWRLLFDGCRPDRDTAECLRTAGFAELELEAFRVPEPPLPRFVSPHVAGVGTKATGEPASIPGSRDLSA